MASESFLRPLYLSAATITHVGYDFIFALSGHTITIGSILLRVFPEIITTGRSPACSEPFAGFRLAYQISPCFASPLLIYCRQHLHNHPSPTPQARLCWDRARHAQILRAGFCDGHLVDIPRELPQE